MVFSESSRYRAESARSDVIAPEREEYSTGMNMMVEAIEREILEIVDEAESIESLYSGSQHGSQSAAPKQAWVAEEEDTQVSREQSRPQSGHSQVNIIHPQKKIVTLV